MATPLTCVVCHKPITGRYVSNIWQLPYHPEHGVCASCYRPIRGRASGARCAQCHQTRITDVDTAVRRARIISSLLGDRGIDLPEGEISFRLCRSPEPGREYLGTAVGNFSARNELLRSTISIQRGLPAVQFDYVVAHELTHVWFDLHRLHPDRRTNEGVAELTAYWILGIIDTPTARTYQRLIATNPDPVYGTGFRLARSSEQRYGWPAVLAVLLRTGHLPSTPA